MGPSLTQKPTQRRMQTTRHHLHLRQNDPRRAKTIRIRQTEIGRCRLLMVLLLLLM
jgi:hypothetical protein